MTTHHLKVHPAPYQDLKHGDKTWEARKNDRDYKVGDYLVLKRWDPATRAFTPGAAPLVYAVTHVQAFGMEPGYVGLSIKRAVVH